MILNPRDESFPTVYKPILKKNNNFNMTSFSTSVELYFKISVRPSGLFLHIESEIYFFGYFRVISPGVSLSFSKNPFQKKRFVVRNMYFVPFSGIFAQLSGGPLWSDLSSSGFMASL